MQLFLVRHTSVAVAPGICYGGSDVALQPTWRDEWTQVRARLPKDLAQVTVYSSPLSRCLTLAKALKEEVHLDERIREFHFGDWELKPWDHLPRHDVASWAEDIVRTVVPGGENVLGFYERTSAFFDELVGSVPTRAVVVTHGGVVRCLVAKVLAMPLTHVFNMEVDFGGVTEIGVRDGRLRVKYFNR